MRPQMGPLSGQMTAMAGPIEPTHEADLEDLGWNDMGEDHEHERNAPAALTPAPHRPPQELAPREPEVRRQQRAIAETIVAQDERHQPAVAKPGRRAAFTLRLDADRHLKLRLASTMMKRSAQALVTEALDKLLAEIPEIDALAAQLQRD
jgi:hypothetical protein